MTIVKWEPFRNVSDLQNRINRVFYESFYPTGDPDEKNDAMCAWRPAVDIYETDKGLVIMAELPGVEKDDVSVEVRDNMLTIKGDRVPDHQIREEQYYRRERCFGTFHRSFTLQDIVNPDNIKASFKDGVLEITVPHPEVEKSKQIQVTIE